MASRNAVEAFVNSLKPAALIRVLAKGVPDDVTVRVGKPSVPGKWAFLKAPTYKNATYSLLDGSSNTLEGSTEPLGGEALVTQLAVLTDLNTVGVESVRKTIFNDCKSALWNLFGDSILAMQIQSLKREEKLVFPAAEIDDVPAAKALLESDGYALREDNKFWVLSPKAAPINSDEGVLRNFERDEVEINSRQLARHLVRHFMGWVYASDESAAETVYGSTFAMDPDNPQHGTPHKQIHDRLKILMRDATVVDVRRDASVRTWHVLHQGETSSGAALLVPVGLRVKPNVSGRATLCRVGGFAAKTAECLRHEAELIRRIRDRAAKHGRISQRGRSVGAEYSTIRDIERNVLQSMRGGAAALASALRDMAVIHSIFSDGGRRFKDQGAEKLAREKLERTINSIAAALTSRI